MSKKAVSLILILFGTLSCFPVVWLFVCSVTGKQELSFYLKGILEGAGETHFFLFPSFPGLRGYVELLMDNPEFYVVFWNSVKLTGCIVVFQMIAAVPAAFGFSRWKGRWSSILFYIYTLLMLLPFQVTMLSNYLVMDRLKLLDTELSVILPAVFSTFPVFIMYRFFASLPGEVAEAFSLDSNSQLLLFWHIGIPMVKPGLTAAALLGVVEYWNMIEQPLLFLKTPSLWPFSLYMPKLTEENIPYVFVFSFLVLLPMLMLMLWGKEDLESGIGTMAGKQ